MSLFILGHMQEELQDRRSLFRKHALELVDVPVAAPPLHLGHQIKHAHNQHVFVMRAVENADLACSRRMAVYSPQVVVTEFAGRGLREAGDRDTLGVETAKNFSNGAVLATRIHGLEDDKQLVTAVRPQEPLKAVEAPSQCRGIAACWFLLRIGTGISGVVCSEINGRSRCDSIAGAGDVGGGVGHLAQATGIRTRSGARPRWPRPILCGVIKSPRIAPSILAADFAKLGAEVARVEDHVDMLHVDVMDGHFVPNISLGIPVIASLRKATKLPLDCHLMISNPSAYLEALAEAGADLVTVHIEAVPDPTPVAERAADAGLDFGLVVNPGTPFAAIAPFVELCDMVLVMSVEPGFGGQSFMSEVLPKVTEARKFVDVHGLRADVQIDGGIGPDTIGVARAAGADVFVAGSSIFGTADPVAAVAALRQTIEDEEQNARTHSRS